MTMASAQLGRTNWAGNITFGAARVHRPASVDEVRRLVAGANQVRALGTGHSFNDIADTTGDLVSVAGLPRVVDIDSVHSRVRVAAGLRYGEFVADLDAAGLALPNLGSLPHISVAGACATGTHGSGDRNGNLSTAVSAVDIVTADGDLRAIGRGDGDFPGAVVALGALGVVVAVTLDLVPHYQMAQHVYEDLPRETLDAHLDEVFASGYSVSAFTDWRGGPVNQVWRKRRVDGPLDAPPTWLGARLAGANRHPLPGIEAAPCTEQLGRPGPWHQRLPHFRLEFTPSAGEELQSEFFVPRAHAVDALRTLDGIRDRFAPVLQISELRTVAADELWLSPAFRRDSLAIHFTWRKDPARVTALLPAIEERLAPFGARPHWGKLFTLAPDVLAERYERLTDFARLRAEHDPTGKFANAFLQRCLGGLP
jgi:xylitol oxidase